MRDCISPARKKLQEAFLQIHITARCNLACTHCYMEAGGPDMSPELFARSLDQFSELLKTLSPLSAWIQITGGEPLLHPLIWEYLARAAERFSTRLLSNGTLIDAAAGRKLKQLKAAVQISFDGLEAAHDRRRGKGAFQAAWKGLMNLQAAEVPRSVRATVAQENLDDMEPLLARVSPHSNAFNLSRVVPFGPCSMQLPDKAGYRQLIYRLYSESRKNPIVKLRDPFFGVLLSADDSAAAFHGCSAGINNLCIAENGDIYPCRRLPVKLGNIQTDSLAELYRTDALLISLRQRTLLGACGKCEDKQVCGGSRCIAYALTGNPLAEDSGCIFV